MVTALAIKSKVRSQKYQKTRYAIVNNSKKELSKIIKYFEIIGKVPYVERIPKHEPTSSYYNLVRCIAKCMLRSDEQNWHVHGSYTGKTAPSSNANVPDKDKSREIIVHDALLEDLSKELSSQYTDKNLQ